MLQNQLKINGRLLIVDDEGTTPRAIQDAFERWGCDATCVDSAEKAIDILMQEQIDVVILDLKMPGIDGLTMLEEVQSETPDTAFIILTAYASTDTAISALRFGVVDYLRKPVSLETIGDVVQRALQRQQEKRRKEEALQLLQRAVSTLNIHDTDPLIMKSVDLKTAAIEINEQLQTAVYHGEPLDLTPVEYRLLKAFVQHPNSILSYRELAVHSHQMRLDEEEARTLLRTHVYRLSRKLGDREKTPLQNVRGRGVILYSSL